MWDGWPVDRCTWWLGQGAKAVGWDTRYRAPARLLVTGWKLYWLRRPAYPSVGIAQQAQCQEVATTMREWLCNAQGFSFARMWRTRTMTSLHVSHVFPNTRHQISVHVAISSHAI